MIITKKKLERMIRVELEQAAFEAAKERNQYECTKHEWASLSYALHDIDRRLCELEKRKESNEACGVSPAR